MFEIRPILSALRQHKSRAVLIILQMALILAIVSNALFIIDGRIALMNRETGYAKEQIFSFAVVPLDGSHDMSTQVEVDEQILRDIPGVIDAVLVNHAPLAGSGSASTWSVKPTQEAGELVAGRFMGDEHTLATMGLTLLEGRNFTADEVEYGNERQGTVVIINQSIADKMFPAGDALGKTIYRHGKPSKIIGIVGIMQGMWVNWSGFDDNTLFAGANTHDFLRFMVRTEPQARASVMAQFEQKLLASFDARVISQVHSMEENIARSYSAHNAMRIILTVMILMLLFVTVIGIFGLSAFSVNQRTRQIGIRRALGATKTAIVRYFLVENCLMAAIGLAIGLVLAKLLNYFLVNQYGVSQLNNAYVLGTMFVILLVSLAAVLIPALKAAQISPALATR